MPPILRLRFWLAACALATLAATATTASADAHPLGSPLGARLAASGSEVTVSWVAPEDDWMALGYRVGTLPTRPGTLTAFQAIRRSTAVRDYLLSHITVTQAGSRCAGTAGQDIPDDAQTFLREGIPFTFSCPAEVAAVDVHISALTDVDDRYRTKAVADAKPGEAIYTKSRHTRRWDFSTSVTAPWSGWVPLTISVAAAAVLTRIGWLVRRRLRQARPS